MIFSMSFVAMFLAAFTSAFALCPQLMHSNISCDFLFSLSMIPHLLHLWDVCFGGIITTSIPASCALYFTFVCKSWYDQFAKNDELFLMPVKSSNCIVPHPFLIAYSTIYLL